MKKTYFLAPTYDSPPSGPISLGAIIISPKAADEPLAPPLPIPPDMPTTTLYKTDWYAELSKARSGHIGLWFAFLQTLLGIGANLELRGEEATRDTYAFERLETHSFLPSLAYVKQSVERAEVQAYLERRFFRPNVYMITGVKIAIKPTVSNWKEVGCGGNGMIGVDGAVFGVPDSLGPEAGWERRKAAMTGFKGGSDFVFAFRVREIYYRKKRIVQKEFAKGALFALEREQRAEGTREERVEFELLGFADEDLGGDDLEEGSEVLQAADEDEHDGKDCEVVVYPR